MDKSAEKINTAALRSSATRETELYLSIENTIEERLRAFNKKLRQKLSRTRIHPISPARRTAKKNI